ncbi:MAG TPA: hypothetical protein VFT87_02700, partial [Candidatus Saccharimonadales bacterium]|nr:hypothetical protein [Candidatus Saccharimonadales bacterium]
LTLDSVNSRLGLALTGSVLPTHTLDVNGATNLRGAGTGDSLTVSNAASTGNILVLKDNTTTVATVADGGLTTFQNSANNANAFRILDSGGTGEHLGVDTADSILRMLANNTGHLNGTGSTWSTATSLPDARCCHATVSVNGYIYSLGGLTAGGSKTATVSFARANSDGSLSSWTATTSLPQTLGDPAATVYNGYIYIHGGADTAGNSQDVYYAKPNADGTITAWATQDNPTNLIDHVGAGMTAHNGYLYITGGEQINGTNLRHVYYGRIQADGSVPSFTVLTDWLSDNEHVPAPATVANGYLYVFGSANYNRFYYGKINADGSVATATEETDATSAQSRHSSIAVMNGYIYVIGGGSTALNTIQYSALSGTGDMGAFTTDTTTLPATRTICADNAPVINNYVYLIGCGDSSFTSVSTVYYASTSKIRVGGGLDLVGYSGEGMAEGGTGGQLTAGNTFVNGTLSVTGNTNLKDGATVSNNFSVTGLSYFKTSANSTDGFKAVNASDVPLFVLDTTNSRAYIGNPTADTSGALLVLDTKNNASDPTGVDGGMYYSSIAGTFRCYEAGAWTECIGIPKPNTDRTAYFVANGSNETWTGYGDVLTNAGPAGSGGALSTDFVPSVYNDTASSIGSVAGVSGNDIHTGSRVIYQSHLDSSETSVRTWIGLTNQTIATMGASATPAGAYAAFRYDTGAGDATWQCVTRNGASSTVTNSSIAINNDQKFEIVLDAGARAVFKINGQVVCNVTATVPDAVYRVVNSVTALDASLKTIYVGWIYVQGDPT